MLRHPQWSSFPRQHLLDEEQAVLPPLKRSGIRVGVVGCGYWGSKHIRILSSLRGVSQVFVIEPDRRLRHETVSAFPAAHPFTELATAIPHLDAVIIATPPCTHAQLALDAVRHGKHVLVEKPLTTSPVDAHALVVEAERNNVVLMVGHTFEFNPAVRELKRRIRNGELGRIHYIHSSRLNLGLYRSDVNVVWDLAVHDISIMNYLLDSVPCYVNAWGSANTVDVVEDLAFIKLDYSDVQVTGYAHVSWLDPKKVRKVTVVGSRKMAVYDDMDEDHLRIYDRGVEDGHLDSAPFARPVSYRYGDIVSPHIPFEEPLLLEVRNFVESIERHAVPQTDGRNGLAVVSVLEAVSRSLTSGTVCRVEKHADMAEVAH
jgi:predicted dehydrogenase